MIYLFFYSQYIFSEENLCLDTYIRSYMDEQGWVPLALIYCYPNVMAAGVPLPDIAEAIHNNGVPELSADMNIQAIKLNDKWERVSYISYRYLRSYPLLYTQYLYSTYTTVVDAELYGSSRSPSLLHTSHTGPGVLLRIIILQ